MADPDTGFEVENISSYDEILRLERNLLAASKSKGPFDPSVRRLRNSIRDSYEALFLTDHAVAESLEIEQALWRLHHREIEGFRIRIRKLLVAKAAHEEDAVQGRGTKRKKCNRQEPLQRLLTALKSFLGEASGFFYDLLIKIRLRNGLRSDLGNSDRLAGVNMQDEVRCCMISCHRLLINLGDLARYKELYVVMNPLDRDWSVAADHYKQAAYLWPASGQPYNQLAVLCTYSGDNLMALCLYCRSLAVSVPFITAWDNLKLLFEKNKQCIAQASPLRNKSDLSSVCVIKPPTCVRDVVVEKDSRSTEEVSSSCQWFVLQFVKLVGILLTQSSSEELEEVVELIQRDLEHFVFAQFNSALHMKKSLKIEGSTSLALQVHVILIFCLHHIIGRQGTLDQEILNITLKFALKFAALSAEVAAKSEMCSIFPVSVIFMEWLASEPKTLQTVGEKSMEVSYIEFCEKIMAFDTILMNKAVVNDILEDQKVFRRSDKDDLLAVPGKAQCEDHELLGFVPLASTHLNLDFANPPPWDGAFDFARYLCWKLRYTTALQKLNEAYQESTAHHASSGEKESPPVSSFEAAHIKSTAEAILVGVHPVLSLKEWVEKSYFPTDVLCNSAFTKQVGIQCSGTGDTIHAVEGSALEPVPERLGDNLTPEKSLANLVSRLGADSLEVMVQTPKFVSEQLECNDKPLSIDTQQAALPRTEKRMYEVPFTNNEVLVSPSGCRLEESQLITNPSHSSECCLAGSSVMLKGDKSPRKFQQKETENLSVLLRAALNDSGVDLPRKNMVVSLFSQEQPTENRNCFDDFTHVKPVQNMEAPSGSRFGHSLGVGLKKNETLMTYTKLHMWRQNSYVTKNPFVLRIKKCVDL